MSKKYTPWFPGDVKPVHPGLYEASSEGNRGVFYFWSGARWEFANPVIRTLPCNRQDKRWRGLAKKPATKDAEVSQ